MSHLTDWLDRQHFLIRVPGWLLIVAGFPVLIYLLIWLFVALGTVCVALSIPWTIWYVITERRKWNRMTPDQRAIQRELNNALCSRIDKQWGSTF